ncbi:MAG: acetate--CoA ligase family protein, partial [Planctomycetes bacterium]|nr:acetate--CoA ligase family protein [Planctomycetota bacterium]
KAAYPSFRIVGPNCLGVLRTSTKLNASFSPVMPDGGRLSLVSQSGALCTAILDWSVEREIGFATCVSMGNMVDVGFGDLIDYFASDIETDALLLYIESLDDASHFMTAASKCSQSKPVIAYKAGRFTQSSHAASSHTGAIASSDAIYDVAFRQAGVERVDSIEELFDCAKLLVRHGQSTGKRLAIITNAGGPGVMAADTWLAKGGLLPELDRKTIDALNASLPTCWSHGNPIDVLGDASADRFEAAINLVLNDSNIDAVLVIVTPQAMTNSERIADVVSTAKQRTKKTIVASWIGGRSVQQGRNRLRQAGIPVYDFPEEAVGALNHLASVEEHQAEIPLDTGVVLKVVGSRKSRPEKEIINKWRQELSQTKGLLGEVRSKQLLADFGIPTVRTQIAHSSDEAIEVANELGYPVVMKILSPDISHKTDVGGVQLGIPNASEIERHFHLMMQSVRVHVPQAQIEGVTIQTMIAATRGIELLVGVTRDVQFGPVMLIGAGGVTAELQHDSALGLPPFDVSHIEGKLRTLRLYPLLEGYRGRPGINLSELTSLIARFGQIAIEFPAIQAIEINPLLVTPQIIMALDARIICDPPACQLQNE